MTTTDSIIEVLQSGPKTGAELLTALGLPEESHDEALLDTIHAAICKLRDAGHIAISEGVWTLKGEDLITMRIEEVEVGDSFTFDASCEGPNLRVVSTEDLGSVIAVTWRYRHGSLVETTEIIAKGTRVDVEQASAIEASSLRPGMETEHVRIVGVATVDFPDGSAIRVKIEPRAGRSITACARYYQPTEVFRIVPESAVAA